MPLKKRKRIAILLFATWGVFLTSLFARMIRINDHGVWVGHENVWSDWPMHIGMATIFATKPPALWFKYHPMYAQGKLTYTFLTNLISALFMRMGFSVDLAFIIPSIGLALLLLYALFRALTRLLESEGRAFGAISLFFLASGLGFLDWIRDTLHKPAFWPGLLQQILNPDKQYSRMDPRGWYSGNFLVGHFIPQRSFLIGMPLGIASLGILLAVLDEREPGRPFTPSERWRLIGAGLLAGILPIAHMHSLIALMALVGPMLVYRLFINRRFGDEWQAFLSYVVPAGAFSATLYFWFIHGGIEAKDFMYFHLGYEAKGVLDWFDFWFRAWGFMIPAAIVGYALMFKRLSIERRLLFFGFFLTFIIANSFQFQPVRWDNTKIMVYSYLGFAAMATETLLWLARKGRVARIGAVVLTVSLVWTGTLELIKLNRIDTHLLQILDPQQMQIGELVREQTGPLERFLTNTDHNHYVMSWGARPILLGFTPWAWNFGFNYQQTEADVKLMYKGGDTIAPALLKKYAISYVVIGPSENANMHPNEDWYRAHFKTFYSTADYRIYDVRPNL